MTFFTYPEFPAEYYDFPPVLFFSEAPLHQVLSIFSRQCHVSSGHCRVGCARKNMRLSLEVRVHSIGIDDPHRVIIAHLVAVS